LFNQSVVPAMLSHYLVDSMGQIFFGVDGSNPALATGFFLLLTLAFPVVNVLLTRMAYKMPRGAAESFDLWCRK
jgi:hypothetical protein